MLVVVVAVVVVVVVVIVAVAVAVVACIVNVRHSSYGQLPGHHNWDTWL